ncbi:MAG: response regulator transcription factor [Elusimicrobia bacterium]|nr:response regulator transcription factor [Elusimicrobiota bacterium]
MAREILVATADPQFLESVRRQFDEAGISLRVLDHLPDLAGLMAAGAVLAAVLDLDLKPHEPPWDMLSQARLHPQTAKIPIVAVTGLYSNPRFVIEGLKAGAVEYLLKPVDPRVLAARVEALAAAMERRRKAGGSWTLRTADDRIVLDLKAHKCLVRGPSGQDEEAALSPKEFSLLAALLGRFGELVRKEELLRVLRPSATRTTRANEVTLAQFIAHLRSKVPALKGRLKTVWGLGFRLE